MIVKSLNVSPATMPYNLKSNGKDVTTFKSDTCDSFECSNARKIMSNADYMKNAEQEIEMIAQRLMKGSYPAFGEHVYAMLRRVQSDGKAFEIPLLRDLLIAEKNNGLRFPEPYMVETIMEAVDGKKYRESILRGALSAKINDEFAFEFGDIPPLLKSVDEENKNIKLNFITNLLSTRNKDGSLRFNGYMISQFAGCKTPAEATLLSKLIKANNKEGEPKLPSGVISRAYHWFSKDNRDYKIPIIDHFLLGKDMSEDDYFEISKIFQNNDSVNRHNSDFAIELIEALFDKRNPDGTLRFDGYAIADILSNINFENRAYAKDFILELADAIDSEGNFTEDRSSIIRLLNNRDFISQNNLIDKIEFKHRH